MSLSIINEGIPNPIYTTTSFPSLSPYRKESETSTPTKPKLTLHLDGDQDKTILVRIKENPPHTLFLSHTELDEDLVEELLKKQIREITFENCTMHSEVAEVFSTSLAKDRVEFFHTKIKEDDDGDSWDLDNIGFLSVVDEVFTYEPYCEELISKRTPISEKLKKELDNTAKTKILENAKNLLLPSGPLSSAFDKYIFKTVSLFKNQHSNLFSKQQIEEIENNETTFYKCLMDLRLTVEKYEKSPNPTHLEKIRSILEDYKTKRKASRKYFSKTIPDLREKWKIEK